jgi:integrase
MAYTGLGPKDALALPRNSVRNGEIATTRSKTGEPVFWPIPAPLAVILDHAPHHMAMTLCAHSGGRPWSQGGFSASWTLLRRRLEREGRIGPGLTLYGLRHTMAVILRESGCDERAIADALGQKTIEMARHYAEGADRGMIDLPPPTAIQNRFGIIQSFLFAASAILLVAFLTACFASPASFSPLPFAR